MTEDIRILLKLTRSTNPDAQQLAIRALGRYESREFIPDLIQFLPSKALRSAAARAIVQAFRGPVLPTDSGGLQVQQVMDLLNTHVTKDDMFITTAATAIAQLPYERPDQANAAQAMLREFLRRAEGNASLSLGSIVGAIEWFARTNRKISPLGDDMIERLRQIARAPDRRRRDASELATAALVAAGAMDIETIRSTAVDTKVPDMADKRRLSAIVLGGTSLEVDEPEREHLLKKLLRDDVTSVRIEAVRAWTRRVTPVEGCELLMEMLKDPNQHVMLTALDALGDACPDDINVTDLLTADVKTPPTDRSWHRTAHALVALAKRAPDRVKIPLNTAFISHPVWQVRMYGARSAAMLKDTVALERFAVDPHDNVREAALPVLRALKGEESDPIFIAALRRSDYQLLRTASNALAGATSTAELSGALMTALRRVTAEKKETSRDTRLALIERLTQLGTPDQAEQLAPLLRDFDIPVALAALALYEQWTGPAMHLFGPAPLPRPPLPSPEELSEDLDAVITMGTGGKFGLRFLTSQAPLTVTRFKRLARGNYYDGLTFHRVVPNFVIQGGSPGANEYAGDAQFVRDEIGAGHVPYSVGLSTRGRDTGDAQFFINLIENRRLNPDYTVFAVVCGADPLAIESIVEGDRIERITLDKFDPCRPKNR